MGQGLLAIVLAAVLLAAIVAAHIGGEKKLRRKIAEQFGKRPAPNDDELAHIAAYWTRRRSHDASEHHIDDVTWDDLDMDKVFRRIDACQSGVGASVLYAMLREPCFDAGTLERREALMTALSEDAAARLELQVYLAKTGRPPGNALAAFCYEISEKRVKRPWIFQALTLLPLVFIGVIFVHAYAGAALLALSLVTNGVVYYRLFRHIEAELEGVRQFAALLWCAGKIVKTRALDGHPIGGEIAAGYAAFRHLSGRLSGLTKQKVSDLDFIMEYVRIVTLYNIRDYNRVIRAIDENAGAFRALYRAVGELDALIAVASYRAGLDFFCRPVFVPESRLDMEDAVHPLVEKPVANSLRLTRGCLISGSNASGKSTFIKAAAIGAILAQTVNTCLARRFEMRRALVMTSMAVRDDVTAGESYFVTEIKSLRRILDKHVFFICFIDEILKGTNTAERVAASAATLQYLRERDGLCVAATHDTELTRMLQGGYDNRHFEETVADGGIAFDYKIKPGPAQTRNAIRLLEVMGFDGRIISDAQRLARGYDATGQWPDGV